MHVLWVLGTWLATWFLSIFRATKAPVGFKLNGRFVRPEYILEVVFKVLTSPLESFHLGDITNELTLGCHTENHPRLFRPLGIVRSEIIDTTPSPPPPGGGPRVAVK